MLRNKILMPLFLVLLEYNYHWQKIKKEVEKNPYFPNHTVFLKMLIVEKNMKEGCMMNTIVNEKLIPFKELEQKIFEYICDLGREITQIILERYDEELKNGRDKKKLRCKGTRRTTIKTVYGEVEYGRNVYKGKDEEGRTIWIYLLDEAMSMDKIGMISTNLAEKIAASVTENPYRVTAEIISSTCGQAISHGGVWNLIQQLGERISKEENVLVSEMNADVSRGNEITKILFEEMDGVWLKMQGKDHKRKPKQEMKVAVMYEGWKEDGKQNSRLSNKLVCAGMEKAPEFHAKREAFLRNKYNVDEIELRILNGDGGSWITDPYEPETVFQLDRFHIHQDIRRKIHDKKAQKDITELFEAEKIEEMFEYIKMYADSVTSENENDKQSSNALKLYEYLENNRKGLQSYQKRGLELPEPKEGIIYKNMGVQENQNCTTITMRMKGRRMRWSNNGANNMAKVLASKENKQLYEIIERYTDGLVTAMQMEEIIPVLSVAKAPKKDGKGNVYVDLISHHMPILEAMQTASRKAFKRAFA